MVKKYDDCTTDQIDKNYLEAKHDISMFEQSTFWNTSLSAQDTVISTIMQQLRS
jgi:hypothetical protein